MNDDCKSASSTIHKQAADWLARRHSGAWNMQDKLALEAWLKASPDHRQAYQRLQALWNRMDGAKKNVAALSAAAYRYQSPGKAHHTRQKQLIFSAAASLLLALAGGYDYWLGFERHYATAKGERKQINLADGSLLALNTDTELTVRFGAFGRLVSLLKGEVLFNVNHDAERPFIVRAGAGQIEDIGTRFDVYAKSEQVEIQVFEGEVQVARAADQQALALLSAGQSLAYDVQGQTLAGYHSDVANATAWLDGTLVFKDLPLPAVVAQLSRYHPVSFELADSRLHTIKISGSFQADNLALLLKTLQASFPIKIVKLDDQHIRIQSR